jgi:2-keto-4-pentenoate hydratase/2-oxohepta-3-ene-1,7-dioic acid hydratase in catechol pathway
MRIGRIEVEGESSFAVEAVDGTWLPLDRIGIDASTIAAVIGKSNAIAGRAAESSGGINEPEFLCPLFRPSKMLGIGLNYMGHIREQAGKAPEYPIVFAKYPSSLNDPTGDIVVDPELTQRADYEAELAVVVGAKVRDVPEDSALNVVFGYTVANDVSARDLQRRDSQFSRSKSFDTYCPAGPWITTADHVPDPNGLQIRSWVNGDLRQDSTTKEMIFDVPFLISYLSRGITLEPGDVILTGTPEGVGFAMDPPSYLSHGDLVVCEVEGLGRISNQVVAPE